MTAFCATTSATLTTSPPVGQRSIASIPTVAAIATAAASTVKPPENMSALKKSCSSWFSRSVIDDWSCAVPRDHLTARPRRQPLQAAAARQAPRLRVRRTQSLAASRQSRQTSTISAAFSSVAKSSTTRPRSTKVATEKVAARSGQFGQPLWAPDSLSDTRFHLTRSGSTLVAKWRRFCSAEKRPRQTRHLV
jgi:hypothetical protein